VADPGFEGLVHGNHRYQHSVLLDMSLYKFVAFMREGGFSNTEILRIVKLIFPTLLVPEAELCRLVNAAFDQVAT
jgi:hypothetical protein